MMRELRHEKLLEYLRLSGPSRVEDIVAALGSSPATIRRDLDALAEGGRLVRTWGGAKLAVDLDDPFSEALQNHAASKRAMARLAAELVPDGATVVLDIGTSTHYVAAQLARRDVSVITPSLPVFEQLKDTPGDGLVLLGGEWSPRYQCFEGSVTCAGMRSFTPDIAFLGCTGVSDRGQVRDNSDAQMQFKRAVAECSTRRVLLADASKFPGHGSTAALTLTDIDVLVTDTPLPDALAEMCAQSQTEVLHP